MEHESSAPGLRGPDDLDVAAIAGKIQRLGGVDAWAQLGQGSQAEVAASFGGGMFDQMLANGRVPIGSAWLNRVAQVSPWEERGAVAEMLELVKQFETDADAEIGKQEFSQTLRQLEKRSSFPDAVLRELHDLFTTFVRAYAWLAVWTLWETHPEWCASQFGPPPPSWDEPPAKEPFVFKYFRTWHLHKAEMYCCAKEVEVGGPLTPTAAFLVGVDRVDAAVEELDEAAREGRRPSLWGD